MANITASLSRRLARIQRLAETLLTDRIDECVRDGQKTFAARILTTVLMGAIAAIDIGLHFALVWAILVIAGEFIIRILWRRYFSGDTKATAVVRAVYLTVALTTVLVWTSMSWMLWVADIPTVSAGAIVILATMIIHAEAFTFRSVPVLVVTGAPPALLLILLPWTSAASTGIEGITFAIVAVLGVGYACVSVHAHRATAKALRAAQGELEHFAYFDALTSLANRRHFTDRLRRLIASTEIHGTRFALLLLDLDHFKGINDALGHDAGDALLIAIGGRLGAAVRSEDNVARLGGDEFAILLSGADDAPAIAVVCERIANSCDRAVAFNGLSMRASLSVGFAIFPDNGACHETLYKSADLALYAAKQSGRNTWRYSDAAPAKIVEYPNSAL